MLMYGRLDQGQRLRQRCRLRRCQRVHIVSAHMLIWDKTICKWQFSNGLYTQIWIFFKIIYFIKTTMFDSFLLHFVLRCSVGVNFQFDQSLRRLQHTSTQKLFRHQFRKNIFENILSLGIFFMAMKFWVSIEWIFTFNTFRRFFNYQCKTDLFILKFNAIFDYFLIYSSIWIRISENSHLNIHIK